MLIEVTIFKWIPLAKDRKIRYEITWLSSIFVNHQFIAIYFSCF